MDARESVQCSDSYLRVLVSCPNASSRWSSEGRTTSPSTYVQDNVNVISKG